MTRNLITEIVIRLLGLWILIDNFRNFISFWLFESDRISYYGYRAAIKHYYLKYGAGLIIAFGIAVILVKYSEAIAAFIWRDRKDDKEVIIQNNGTELLSALVAIIGLYITVTVLATAISEAVKYAMSSPQYLDKTYLMNTIIAGKAYELILFIFGMYLFTKPEKIISFRKKLKRASLISKDEVN